MGFFRNITKRSWVADDQGRTYPPLRVVIQRTWLEFFGKEGLHDGYWAPLLSSKYPQDPTERNHIPQGYRSWYGLAISNPESDTVQQDAITHAIQLPKALTSDEYKDLNSLITEEKRKAKQDERDLEESATNLLDHNADTLNPQNRITFGQLWTWRKLLFIPMGIFNLVKFTWAMTHNMFDWCLQHTQMQPYANMKTSEWKAAWIFWMPIFTLIRAGVYIAFKLPLAILETITSPINKILRPLLRFYDDFEPTNKGASRAPFFIAISLAILAAAFIGVALFLSATPMFAYAPIFQHSLIAINGFFEHALTLLPFAFNATAVIASKVAAVFVAFVGSMRLLEAVSTGLHHGIPDAFAFITGQGGANIDQLDVPITTTVNKSTSPYATTTLSRKIFGSSTEDAHCVHIKKTDQLGSFFGLSNNSGHAVPSAQVLLKH